ncbi:redoxin domain-containing protein [Tenacibaculum sp. SG-28]|uniref:TlpA family protein disulfide reductase n=1 Tax=Tenacibaculum sp. SG-28 TaxID=754426 RepID=UPI000CF39526|nr:redoxin domain-containing protein [Tenacibaculum sp. SG-28]PQJ19945.1 hypothetical protein BSU00_11570 [Tenacibaculum sp. SG-28]
MNRLFFVLLLISAQLIFSQDKQYYKDAVADCILDSGKDAAMLDDIVNNCIKNKYLSNYEFTTITGDKISTDAITKPILLVAAATWCAPCWGEIPALNKMVEKYGDKIEVVMLFWDKQEGVQRMAEKLDKRIMLVASEAENSDKSTIEINGFVHKLDYPTTYLIAKDKKIVNFKRGAASPSKKMTWEQVNAMNEAQLEEFLKVIM